MVTHPDLFPLSGRLLHGPKFTARTVELESLVDENRELDLSYELEGRARFRVNIYRQRGSLALVLRIIPSDLPTLAELGLPSVVGDIALAERGLVLVTGATGFTSVKGIKHM